MDKRMEKIGKRISYHLRHRPSEIGISLSDGGWVGISAMIDGLNAAGFPLSRSELERAVDQDDKGRFSIDYEREMIRANQGHSIKVDLMLTPVVPPAVLYHGTVQKYLHLIYEFGLIPRQRNHVHLSEDCETAFVVGARRGEPVVLMIDAARLHRAGAEFFQSTNGVWLTNHVPQEFILRTGVIL